MSATNSLDAARHCGVYVKAIRRVLGSTEPVKTSQTEKALLAKSHTAAITCIRAHLHSSEHFLNANDTVPDILGLQDGDQPPRLPSVEEADDLVGVMLLLPPDQIAHIVPIQEPAKHSLYLQHPGPSQYAMPTEDRGARSVHAL